jgi:hypothetical protein
MTHDPTTEPTPRTADPRRVQSEIMVARRYLNHGFVDVAMRLFARRAEHVRREDWTVLVDALLERDRVDDAVAVCRMGGLPLPSERLLILGDRMLRRKHVDAATHYYELGEADAARWAGLLDVLTRLPGRELTAMEVAQRHLVPAEAPARPLRLSA